MSYFVCLDLDHVKKDMPTKSGVFFLNGLTFHKHKMDALISQSTHYTQFIYEPNHNKVTHSESQEKINPLQIKPQR